jgi:hypothetical protein
MSILFKPGTPADAMRKILPDYYRQARGGRHMRKPVSPTGMRTTPAYYTDRYPSRLRLRAMTDCRSWTLQPFETGE